MLTQRILTEKQAAYINSRLALLAAYEAEGTLEEVRAWKPEPSPLPLDIHLADNYGVDYELAVEAAEAREEEHWHK